MERTYKLLENVLIDVKEGIREGIDADILAKKYSLSRRHLERLFKLTFEQSLAGYIRSRKLVESLSDLLSTDTKLIYIAFEYGFDYEQSYIRAFKREYGKTPGKFRKSGNIINNRALLC